MARRLAWLPPKEDSWSFSEGAWVGVAIGEMVGAGVAQGRCKPSIAEVV
jgi:hypothetical protein